MSRKKLILLLYCEKFYMERSKFSFSYEVLCCCAIFILPANTVCCCCRCPLTKLSASHFLMLSLPRFSASLLLHSSPGDSRTEGSDSRCGIQVHAEPKRSQGISLRPLTELLLTPDSLLTKKFGVSNFALSQWVKYAVICATCYLLY